MNLYTQPIKFSLFKSIIFGAVFLIVINLLTGTYLFDVKGYYATLNKPIIAPPPFLFGIVWPINNILIILGNIWTLRREPSSDRSSLISLQILSWINYALFTFLSFGLKNPFGFFAPTFSMLLLTLASIYFAYKLDSKDKNFWQTVRSGRSITFTFATLVLWLTLASYLGFYIWINN